MALSKQFRVSFLFSEAEFACNQVEENKVAPEDLLEIIRHAMLEITTFAGGALGHFYETYKRLNVSQPSASKNYGTVNVNDLKIRQITSVSVPYNEWDALSNADDGNWHEVFSRYSYNQHRRTAVTTNWGRWFFQQLGEDPSMIYLAWGKSVTKSITKVDVHYRRTPDVSFTLSDARNPDGPYADIPDFFVQYVIKYAAVHGLQRAGVSSNNPRMADLMGDYKSVVTGLNNMIKAESLETEAKNRD